MNDTSDLKEEKNVEYTIAFYFVWLCAWFNFTLFNSYVKSRTSRVLVCRDAASLRSSLKRFIDCLRNSVSTAKIKSQHENHDHLKFIWLKQNAALQKKQKSLWNTFYDHKLFSSWETSIENLNKDKIRSSIPAVTIVLTGLNRRIKVTCTYSLKRASLSKSVIALKIGRYISLGV